MRVVGYILVSFLGVIAVVAEGPDFTTQIRPLLNQKCTGCHGGVKKKGNLSFLIRSEALKKGKSGEIAIKPGDPDNSEVMRRITSHSPDEIMPPEGDPLTAKEQALLRDWIKAGANWEDHWAYKTPKRPAVPTVKNVSWPNGDLDHFVLARLEAKGMAPSTEADRAVLLRRASLDLIGIPPTPADLKRFLQDASADAYEKAIDRLLASPRYGERWTSMWMDLARYADTQGYEKDANRTMWRYRDWLIDAFNQDMPFDQFTTEQLAGDLLPNATMEQKLATAFHRNTMTNTEGGTSDEEYRGAAIIDRVNTTWEVWMGTSINCVQCHSHPYDPFKHEEYFQFYAILNNTADNDQGNEAPVLACPTTAQSEKMQKLKEQIAKLKTTSSVDSPEILAGMSAWRERMVLGDSQWRAADYRSLQSVNGARLEAKGDGKILVGGANPSADTYVVQAAPGVRRISAIRLDALPHASLPHNGPGRADDGNFVLSQLTARVEQPDTTSSPKGRYVRIDLPGTQRYIHVAEVQVFSGEKNLALKGKAKQSTTDYNGPASYAIDNNTVGTYTLQSVSHTAAETDPWWEVDLKQNASIDRITIWNRTDTDLHQRLDGAVISLLDHNRKTIWSQSMPVAPKVYKDFHLNGPIEIPFTAIVASHEQRDFGVNYLLQNPDPKKHGWAISPRIGKPSHAVFLPERVIELPPGATVTITMNHSFNTDRWERFGLGHFRLSFSDDESVRDLYALPRHLRLAIMQPPDTWTAKVKKELAASYPAKSPDLAPVQEKIAALEKELKGMRLPKIPIMQELPKPRETYIFERGNWQAKGAIVQPGTPEILPPMPKGAKGTRLDLAKWLTQPDHPLTSRVMVNRFWEQMFGTGIVKTIEDFGSQGDLPSHPKLLDYLALRFANEHKWSIKSLLREIVLSSTYRQQSAASPEQLALDPDNRLLERGPRFRLSAEQIRDQALAAAGLLSAKMHGPSVMPPQPDGLWSTIYNGSKWVTSTGEDRYRRAIYTFWKRTTPYPSMETFDAPSRVICTNRRIRTNTPLQAMVMLNDPVYVEAAQALAARAYGAAGTDIERIKAAYARLLVREPQPDETKALVEMLADLRAHYAIKHEDAKQFATQFDVGKTWLSNKTPPEEIAAWTMLGSVLLNLDEAATRP